MSDYDDWKVWKEVELRMDEIYLSEYTEYQPEELAELFQSMLTKAESQGLQGCYLKFRSTYEPYEDFLGPAAVTVCGYRKLNSVELNEVKEEAEVEKLAKEMGVAVYEARTVYNLKQQGKL
jgi:hypothetical protein